MYLLPTSPIAIAAVRAARHAHQWGRYATLRYCQKRGVPHSLLTLARVLAAAERFESRQLQPK